MIRYSTCVNIESKLHEASLIVNIPVKRSTFQGKVVTGFLGNWFVYWFVSEGLSDVGPDSHV